ncbi:DUF4241 domain-containing protein [Bifidobacterium choerinum]|uniref:DUF4241 domain-containing protein n=1 Tax=Bifidobacterium choerinum TaxID=35760 RepID=UPI000C1A58B1
MPSLISRGISPNPPSVRCRWMCCRWGDLHLPTGRIIACDPMTELEDAQPYMQTVPPGVYPVQA